MSSARSKTGIKCPIGLFESQEANIEPLMAALNAARTRSEKVPHARDVIDAADALLKCPSFDRANHNCALCRNVSELRLKTAILIVKAGAPGAAR